MNESKLIFILLGIAIFLGFILNFYVIQQDYRVTMNGEDVNNLTACCIEIKNIDYFENYSNLYNVGKTDTAIHLEQKELCVPEKENLVGLNCKQISKKDLDKDWLNVNAKCIESKCPNGKYICGWTTPENQLKHCNKYKFGEYEIEKN